VSGEKLYIWRCPTCGWQRQQGEICVGGVFSDRPGHDGARVEKIEAVPVECLTSDEAIRIGAHAEFDWLNPHGANTQEAAEERDSYIEPFKAGLEALLAERQDYPMPEEKSVERYMCGVKKLNGFSQPYMSPAVQGDWVRHQDHTLALSDKQVELDLMEEDRDRVLARLSTSN
jgi:hypothetical protein